MKCKFYAQKGNEQKERDTCDRFNLTGLDSYLLEFTTRNLRGFVLKILKIMLFSKQISYWTTPWDIKRLKSYQRREASIEVRKPSFVFSHNSHRVWEWSIVNSKTSKFWDLAAKLDGKFQLKWNYTRHVLVHGRALHKDLYCGSSLGNR